jgi:hypothetical protein
VTSGVLAGIHRAVGAAQQQVRIAAVERRERVTDGEADAARMAGRTERPLEAIEQLVAELLRATAASTSSPASWPSWSLIGLKPSRSSR